MEVTKLQKEVSRKHFGIEACQDSDKDVQFYTCLPSVAVFYQLLEYLSPSGKRSNVVYNATAQNWEKEGSAVRLHLGLKVYYLAKCFEVSQLSVSRIFSTWITFV